MSPFRRFGLAMIPMREERRSSVEGAGFMLDRGRGNLDRRGMPDGFDD